jgi:colanic acid/amylovoran biosynthesis glycosyltransferase
VKTAAIVYEFPSLSETFVLSQINGLIETGFDVRIFADGADSSANSGISPALLERVRYFGLPLKSVRELVGIRKSRSPSPESAARGDDSSPGRAPRGLERLRLRLEARAFRQDPVFDVIHAHFGPNGVRAVRLRDMGVIRGPVITSFYGYDVGRHWSRSGYDQLFAEGDRFIALGDHMRDQLVALGCPANRIVVHRLGVDLTQFASSPRPVRDRFEIVSIARLIEKKGIEYGLRAVAELSRKKIQIGYTIVGDGPLRESLESLTRSLGIEGIVRFRGGQPHRAIVQLLHDSDVLLAPSVTARDGDVEGTPVAILEAHASGLPVVATRHAGIPEIVEDGESGFLVAERNSAELAERLVRLAGDPSLQQKMGASGMAAVAEKHDIRRLNAELVSIYRGVAAG